MATPAKIAWIVVLVSVIVMVWLKQRSLHLEDEFHQWLLQNNLVDIEDTLRNAGIQSKDELIKTNPNLHDTLDSHQTSRLTLALGRLKLQNWLAIYQLEQFEVDLAKHGISSLDALRLVSTDKLVKSIKWKEKHQMFLDALSSLQSKSDREVFEGNTSEKSTSSFRKVLIVLVILGLIFVILIGIYFCILHVIERIVLTIIDGIVTVIMAIIWVILAGMIGGILGALTGGRVTFPTPSSMRLSSLSSSNENSSSSFSFLRRPGGTRQRHERSGSFHLGLYERITGRTLDISKCNVEWNCPDWIEVGKSAVATVQFKCKNSSDYKLQASDNLQVTVSHKTSRAVLPHAVEPARLVGEERVKISFTARLSGDYSVEIKLNGFLVGSNGVINRHYKPGQVDASKTVFLEQSNTIVVTAGLYHSMQVIPKDRFGNSANIIQDLLTAEIRKGGSDGEPINPECVVDKAIGASNQYEILLKVEDVGHYVGCVKYEGATIGPPSITIISLSESDSATVDKNVAKKCNVYYEAQVIFQNGKLKKVYCYPSPKQIQVKEFLLGIIPKRIYSCKVCPSTRIHFGDRPDVFTIDDGYQSPLCLSSPHREVFAATFYKFLLKNIGGSEKFQDKQTFFYNEVKNLRSYHTRSEINLTISRNNLLDSAMQATRHLSSSDWYKKFSIEFQGEEGLDWGGVSREFFELVCVRCFDPSYHLFMRFGDNPQSLVHPNPRRPSHFKFKYYEFAGRIVGKCLYESALGNTLMVKARFTRSFLAQIIGLRIHHKYFENDNPELYTTKIQYIRDNDVTDLGLVFAEEEFDPGGGGTPIVVPLIDKGDEIEVTNHNKIQYLNLLAQYRLAKCVKEEVEHFLKGLNDIIPDHLLSIFDENELELLMCGMGTVSYNDLKIHAVVNGSNEAFRKVVSWFWTIVSGFTQEEMAKLLQFVTGCSQLPPGGFKDLSPPFQIISAPTHGRLPTAHTCFNQLCLPQYDSYQQFQQALTVALNEGSEGFGFA